MHIQFSFRNVPEYPAQFRSVILNHAGNSKMPIMHLFEPANLRAAVADHTYATEGPVDHFLNACGLVKMNAAEREVGLF